MGTKKYLDTFGVIIHIVYPKKKKGISHYPQPEMRRIKDVFNKRENY